MLCLAEPRDWLVMTAGCSLQPIRVAFGSFKGSGSRGLGCPSGAGAGVPRAERWVGRVRAADCVLHLSQGFEGKSRKQHGNAVSSPPRPDPVKMPPSNGLKVNRKQK